MRGKRSTLPPAGLRWPLSLLLFAAIFTPPARADVFRILSSDQEAAQARVHLIQGAEREINVSYYSVVSGRISGVFFALLRDAAARGVQVRLLTDGLESRIPASVKTYLLEQGVQIREYHPVQLARPQWLNHRMHDKLLIVDCEQLAAGSRNLEDEHFGLECVNFVDRDVYVRGCAAATARAYFMQLWESADVRPANTADRKLLDRIDPPKQQAAYWQRLWRQTPPEQVGGLLDAQLQWAAGSGWLSFDCPADWSAGQPDRPVRFLSDRPGDKHAAGLDEAHAELIEAARRSLLIETPYLVLTKRMKGALIGARQRGTNVQILTNSLASTDSLASYAAYQNEKKQLLRAGIELWEYSGPNQLHAKSLVVDDAIALISSYNFDARSANANLEVAVAAYDAAAACELSASIQLHMANALQIGPDGIPLGSDVRHPQATARQLHRLRRQRVVVPAFRRLL